MTNHLFYVLDGQKVCPEPDASKWSAWSQKLENRRVALNTLGSIEISTVFLGIDHGYDHTMPPVLFETMVFLGNSRNDVYCERYSDYETAQRRHGEIVEMYKSGGDSLGSFILALFSLCGMGL